MSEQPPSTHLIIAGVPKAGTTSLFEYLAQHPDVYPASRKETNYFRPLREEGASVPSLDTYLGFFAGATGEQYLLEASPTYFYGGQPLVEGIAGALPNVRVVVSLREPVSRFWSHYRMKRRKRKATGDRDAVERYVRSSVERRERGETLASSRGYQVLAVGHYAEHLRPWFDTFGDRLRIVFFEDIRDHPEDVVRQLCDWLAIDPSPAEGMSYMVRNRGVVHNSRALARRAQAVSRANAAFFQRHPRLKGWLRSVHDALNGHTDPHLALDPSNRQLLEEIYRPSNELLAAELAKRGYRELPTWLSPSNITGPGPRSSLSSPPQE